ncbi:LuxR family transcriptional regulator [Streptomyces sp. S.PB5]|uniref:helix-turn-helix transcriptional regulator n=1 Tax=Streptomyces sp. S.PB5 TaxID=3020844 RepID=UPI0025B18C90|nr:LuxR family transcriptional regulator [Streptomyces sp. S.PB5]MDN3028537.1 LuxR C-terminal-related transcriptional regulator [Streptomyces sp. S.PB5]
MTEPGARPATLVGRLAETEFLRRFLDQARVNGGALVLSGEAGVGKTELLEATAEAARMSGTTVLRVTGTEFEADVSHAALHQALLPLSGDFSVLGDEQATALRVALGFEVGPVPDRFLLSSAVTMLLRRTAADTPLLLVIDDVPWLDRASAAVLGFAARRLVGSRAGLLAALRTGSAGYFDISGLPELTVPPLDDEAAAHLLVERFPGLDAQTRARVLATAQGNPLALLELPPALEEARRGPARSLPPVLPLGQRLQRLFAARVVELPAPTRRLLLTAALESSGELSVLQAAADGAYLLDDLGPAERDQLVRITTNRHQVAFRHPLIRSAVVAESTSADRRRVHRALASALMDDTERRAWHLGEAAVEPDEEVAALLEAAAHRVLARGDYQAVVTLLCRAADLSPSADGRARRLAEAAYVGAEGMAETKGAAELLDGVRQAGRQVHVSLNYVSAATLLLLDTDGHIDTAHQLLVGAIEAHPNPADAHDASLVNALWTLALVCFVSGRAELWSAFRAALARLAPEPPAVLSLVTGMFGDPVRDAPALLPRLDAALATVHSANDPATVQNLAAAAWYVDRLADVREPLWRLIRAGRAGGPGRRRLVALMDVCVDDFHRGEWAEAAELAAEGLGLCEEPGARFFAWYFRYHQALLAAVQGRSETSRALAEQMTGWAGSRGVGTAVTYARHALVLAALGEGDFEAAYHHATAISPAGTLAAYVPHSLWVALDLVEAAVRTGRSAEAEEHVRVLRETGIADLSPRLAILEAGCTAVVAPDDAAPKLFEQALSLPMADAWPFDTARIRLLHGERLRRSRAATEARTQLRAALTAFEKLGATPWAARAERELRAAGQATRSAGHGDAVTALTPQELEIARLAASGMTNKEIAERLYVSPRTVSSHLYQIFPKLGITKRAALRDAIGTDERRPGDS